MTHASYHQFCPVAMAAEILGGRWTIVLLRELCAGTTHFNDLRRGVPRMSPALLSKRLKELETRGILERQIGVGATGPTVDYVLTDAGRDLGEVVMAIGIWGHRWVGTRPTLEKLDSGVLMWDMRRSIKTANLPDRRVVVQFIFEDLKGAGRNWWVLHAPLQPPDLCSIDPGFDVDLYVRCSLRVMTAIWMGLSTVSRAVENDEMYLVGTPEVREPMQDWLGLSPFAAYDKRAN